jgi:hypothetical protein
VPGVAVGAAQFHLDHFVMVPPGLVQQEALWVLRVRVQRGGDEARFVPHRVQHGIQVLEELLAPRRPGLELDQVGDGHRTAPAAVRGQTGPGSGAAR